MEVVVPPVGRLRAAVALVPGHEGDVGEAGDLVDHHLAAGPRPRRRRRPPTSGRKWGSRLSGAVSTRAVTSSEIIPRCRA